MKRVSNCRRTERFMTVFFVAVCTLFLLIVSVPTGHASDAFPYTLTTDLETTTNPYIITVDTGSSRPLNHKVYGFNTNHTTSSNLYASPNVIEGTGQLRPGILRFPGGTVGNWYQWRTDDFWGWESTAPAFSQSCRIYRDENRKYGWDGYVALIRRYNMEPVIMINILSQTAADAAAWFDYMDSINFPVRYAEFGNENSYGFGDGQRDSNLQTIEDYIRVTKDFSQEIRKNHPNIKLAVNADRWNSTWRDALAEETYYDAVVIHEYQGPGDAVWTSSTVTEYLSGENLVDTNAAFWKDVIGNRPMWITEWNLRIKSREFFRGTGIVGLALASRYMRMLDYDRYEMACLHKDYGNSSYAPYTNTTKWGTFPVLRLIGASTKDCTQVLETTISPCHESGWSFQMSNVQAFREEGKIHFLVLNKLPVAKEVELIVDGNLWTGGGEITWVSYSRLSEKRSVTLDGTLLESDLFQSRPTVPKYSVSHIVINVQGGPITDTTDPTGRITAPATGSTLFGTYDVTADAEDETGGSGVDYVRFHIKYDDTWTELGEDNTAPYAWSWDTTQIADQSGVEISIHIFDKAGNENINGDGNHTDITVQNSGVADTTEPSGRIIAPAAGATISGTYRITAEAEDEAGGSGVDYVRFVAEYNGAWHDLGDDNTAPYTWSWDTTKIANQSGVKIGLHIIDKAGNKNIGGDGSHKDIIIQNDDDADPNNDDLTGLNGGCSCSGGTHATEFFLLFFMIPAVMLLFRRKRNI